MTHSRDTDVLILGAGPGGTTAAAQLAAAGVDVTVLDANPGPVFKIGESLLPEGIRICSQLGLDARLEQAGFQLKHAARFVLTEDGSTARFDFADAERPERGAVAWQVPRERFDGLLVELAEERGAHVRWNARVDDIALEDDGVVARLADGESVRAGWLVDASGAARRLAPQLGRTRPLGLETRVALFAHCSGIPRDDEGAGDIVVLWEDSTWWWLIPFADGTTSVGVVARPERVAGLDDQAAFDTLAASTDVHRRWLGAREQLTPLRRAADYSWTCERVAAPRALLVGDAAGFLDPVFSSGVYLAQVGGLHAAELLVDAVRDDRPLSAADQDRHSDRLRTAFGRFGGMVEQFYDGRFLETVVRARRRPNLHKAITSILAGDVFDDENLLVRMGLLDVRQPS